MNLIDIKELELFFAAAKEAAEYHNRYLEIYKNKLEWNADAIKNALLKVGVIVTQMNDKENLKVDTHEIMKFTTNLSEGLDRIGNVSLAKYLRVLDENSRFSFDITCNLVKGARTPKEIERFFNKIDKALSKLDITVYRNEYAVTEGYSYNTTAKTKNVHLTFFFKKIEG